MGGREVSTHPREGSPLWNALHHPDGTHRLSAASAKGSVVDAFERLMPMHLADGHTHTAPEPRSVEHPPDTVVAASPYGYFVKSRSTAGWWLVNGRDCGCPATVEVCHHVQVAHAWARLQAEPRPTAPTNISALVD